MKHEESDRIASDATPLAIARGRAFTRLDEFPKTLADGLVRTAGAAPDKGIVHVKADGSETFQSYPQLLEDARRVLAGLRARGLQAGDKVILEIQDSFSFVSVFWGCVLGGFVAVPLHVPSSFAPESNEMRKTKNVWTLLGDPLLVADNYLEPKYAELKEHPYFSHLNVTTAEQLLDHEPDARHHDIEPHDLAFLQFSSGSTGDAKGVQLTHCNLQHNLCSIAEGNAYRDDEVFVFWMPYYHDMGLITFHLSALVLGVTQVKMSHDTFVRRPGLYLRKIMEHKGTVTGSPNFGLDWMTNKVKDAELRDLDLSSLRILYNGAEPISIAAAETFIEKFARAGFRREMMRYVYGMAEACVGVSAPQDGDNCRFHTVDQHRFLTKKQLAAPDAKDASTLDLADEGQPLPGMELVILSDQDEILPERCIGHIVMKGPNVTCGYYKNEKANENLFWNGYLRTGDLGCIDNGRLIVSGRNKDIIFINGQNFYAHDIEEFIIEELGLQHQTVVCVGLNDPNTGLETVLIFLKFKQKINDLLPVYQKIKHAVSMELGFEINGVIPVALIPKTTSGKLERYKLRSQYLDGEFDDLLAEINQALREKFANRDIVLPRTETERRLHRIFARVLDVPREEISIRDHIVELASNSLKEMEILREIEEWVGAGKLDLAALFNYPTIEKLAGYLADLTNEGVLETAVTRDLSRAITPLAPQDAYDVTNGQKGLWFIQQMQPDSIGYNEHFRMELRGDMDAAAFQASIQAIVNRHSALRTVFAFDEARGVPVQVICDGLKIDVPFADLTALPEQEREAALSDQFQRDLREPFSLTEGPLVRFRLFKLDEQVHHFYMLMHHIICDFASAALFFQELGEMYASQAEGREPYLPPVPVQFVDYAAWKNRQHEGPAFEKTEQFWLSEMQKPLPVLQLPADAPRPPVQTFDGSVFHQVLDEKLVKHLHVLCKSHNVSLFMVMLAAYFIWLHRLTEDDDLLVGVPLNGRTEEDVQQVIGYFVNTMPVRMKFGGDETFEDVLLRMKQRVLNVLEHQSYPFDLLVETVNPDRDLSRPVLYSTVFNMLNASSEPWSSLQVNALSSAKITCAVDLGFVVVEKGEQVYFDIEYNTSLFRRDTVAGFLAQFEKVLQTFVFDQEAPIRSFDLLTASDRDLYMRLNRTQRDFSRGQTIHARFYEMANRFPNRIAVSDEHDALTYAELNARSNQIARLLRRHGVGPNQAVGILPERSTNAIAQILGVLKAGGCYVPIDPDYPEARMRHMLGESGVQLVLAVRSLRDSLADSLFEGIECLCTDEIGADESTADLDVNNTSDDLAYLIFTSGSTGKPKGTMLRHVGVLNLADAMRAEYGMDENGTMLQLVSFSFDASVKEMFPPLLNGGRVHVLSQEARHSVERFTEAAEASGATASVIPYVLFNQMAHYLPAEHAKNLKTMKYFFIGGEVLNPETVRMWQSRFGTNIEIVNSYGPTEATVWVTAHAIREPLAADVANLPIGKPLPNSETYILNRCGQLCPVGVVGELHLHSVGLAKGYLNQPDKTADSFRDIPVLDPSGQVVVKKLYKTGDMARLLADGSIEFVGRADEQVKVRGHRIEIGEIEEVMMQEPRVEGGAVTAIRMADGSNALVGFYTSVPGAACDVNELKAFLALHLPDYMVPARLIAIDILPLTPNGKVDRTALAKLAEASGAEWKREHAEPVTETQVRLASIWAEVLQQEQVGLNDHFFELGGHSLLATQVFNRIRNEWNANVTLKDLFTHPTLQGLAALLDAQLQAGGQAVGLIIPRAEKKGHYQLSNAQKRLWFLHKLDPKSKAYNVPNHAILKGALDVQAFENALRTLIARHAALRTVFVTVEGEPRQQVLDAIDFHVACEDFSACAADEQQARIREAIRHSDDVPFDLARGPLLRAHLYALGSEETYLYLNMHHIVTDGWSMDVLMKELAAAYDALVQGAQPSLAALPLQHVDYAEWEEQALQSERFVEEEAYWLDMLQKPLPVLELPTDFPRPERQSFHGDALMQALPEELTVQLRALAQQQDVSLFMLLFAGYMMLLQRLSGANDLIVGTPSAGRFDQALEPVVGFFANTLAIRAKFDGVETLRDLLGLMKSQVLDAFQNQAYPFDLLIEKVNPPRDLSRSPIFSTMFMYQEGFLPVQQMGGLTLASAMDQIEHNISKFDLSLMMTERNGCLEAWFEYNTDLFKRETIVRFSQELAKVLDAFVTQLDVPLRNVDLLSEEERTLYEKMNDTRAPFPDNQTIYERFYQVAAQYGSRIAVSDAGATLTYAELNERSNQLAHLLREQGVGQNQIVGIMMERGVDIIVAILGVLKAGGAYVPVDPDYPEDRVRYMLEDSGSKLLVTQRVLVDRLPDGDFARLVLEDIPSDAPAADLMIDNQPEDLAYVIYTSGSTGLPKGTLLHHAGVLNLAQWKRDTFGYSEQDVILQFASYSFDASVWETFPALLNGAQLHLLQGEQRQSLAAFAEAAADTGATAVTLPTVFFNQLGLYLDSKSLEKFATLKRIFVAGEALQPQVVRAWQARFGTRMEIINAYGPTESTVCATIYRMNEPVGEELLNVPIGTPIANTEVFILDERLQPCPVNVVGDLYIGSVGLAIGYLNQPEKTADAFIPHPFQKGAVLYKSGDMARLLPNGSIEYAGRKDAQVKVRGHRVEVGEIEEVLLQHPRIDAVAVLAKKDDDGNVSLIACYTAGATIAAASLKSELSKKLPFYMVPSFFKQLDQMPMLPNGKVDRKTLSQRAATESGKEAKRASALTASNVQEKIIEIWSDALHLDAASIDLEDNFFDIGGHSILLTKVHARITTELGAELDITDLFKYPTVKSLAEKLGAGETAPTVAHQQAARRASEEESVAIIGMALRFPEASTPDEFWQNLREGRESVKEFPLDELEPSLYNQDAELQKRLVRVGGFLDDIDKFEPEFFQISENEARLLDPQHRLFLECAWEAVEDSGYNIDRIEAPVSLYAGVGTSEYLPSGLLFGSTLSNADLYQARMASQPDFMATRVSYKMNLRGESIVVNTTCSTSLVAVHMACQSLLLGQSDYALAGGVSIQMPQKQGYLYEPGFILSDDGHCRAFDQNANGTAAGNGSGVVFLKRLSDAVRDGDPIYAVIKGSAINNDGSDKVGYTAPSLRGQADVIAKAQQAAGVTPDEITYIEAHGTGTKLGDPIEVAALTDVFRTGTDRTQYCALGAVKSNVGHLNFAAGVAGLAKVALSLEHGELPPTLNVTEPNPAIRFEDTPFYLNTELQPWTSANGPRRAGVSSFGMGGTNVHAILEEAPTVRRELSKQRPHHLFTLSARTQASLSQAVRNLGKHVASKPNQALEDLAYTYQVGRRHFDHRLMLSAKDRDELLALCEKAADLSPRPGISYRTKKKKHRVAFLFTGQGSQYFGMARELYETSGLFKQIVDECADILAPHFPVPFTRYLFDDAHEHDLHNVRIATPALFVMEYALAHLWMSWGIRPDYVMGQSLGEYVAACIAGAFSLRDGLLLVVERGRLMQEAEAGTTLSILASQDIVSAHITPYADEISIATINGPQNILVSGRTDAIDKLCADLERAEIAHKRLPIPVAFHSPLMEPILGDFKAYMEQHLIFSPVQIPLVSNLTGATVEGKTLDADYWCRHLRGTVQFARGIDTLLDENVNVFLEIGTHPIIRTVVERVTTPDHLVLGCINKKEPNWKSLLDSLGQLYADGLDIDWDAYNAEYNVRRVHAPTYPFDRKSYWLDIAPSAMTYHIQNGLQEVAATAEAAQEDLAERSTEELIIRFWGEVLGVENLSPDDNFADLGGDSLNMIQVQTRIHNVLKVDIALQDLFDCPVLRDLVARVDALRGTAGAKQAVMIPRAAKKELYELSNAQKRLYFLYKMNPADVSYVIPGSSTLRGLLHLAALEQALRGVIDRHDSLRTVFVEENGIGKQRVLDAIDFALPVHDFRDKPKHEQEQLVNRLIHDDQQTPYVLETGPLFRAMIFRLADDEHRLYLSMHHIISDGWSYGVLFHDLSRLYGAILQEKAPALPTLQLQYADFAEWQHDQMQQGAWDDQEQYWLTTLAKPLPELDLPTDCPRPATALTGGSDLPLVIPSDLVTRLKETAKASDASLFMLLFAAYVHFLHALSNERDLIVGIPIAGRIAAELEPMIGFFINTAAIRVQIDPEASVRALVQQVKTQTLGAFANQLYPFDTLVEKLNPERRVNRSPIFTTMFNLMNTPMDMSLPGLEMTLDDMEKEGSKFDLRIALTELGGDLVGKWEYATELFQKESIERMITQYLSILDQYAENLDATLDDIQVGAQDDEDMDDLLSMFIQD